MREMVKARKGAACFQPPTTHRAAQTSPVPRAWNGASRLVFSAAGSAPLLYAVSGVAVLRRAGEEDGEEVAEFVVDVGGGGDGLGDLGFHGFAETLAEAVDGDFHRAFAEPE